MTPQKLQFETPPSDVNSWAFFTHLAFCTLFDGLTSGLVALYATCIFFKNIFDDLQKLSHKVLQIKHLTKIGLLILLYSGEKEIKSLPFQ